MIERFYAQGVKIQKEISKYVLRISNKTYPQSVKQKLIFDKEKSSDIAVVSCPFFQKKKKVRNPRLQYESLLKQQKRLISAYLMHCVIQSQMCEKWQKRKAFARRLV